MAATLGRTRYGIGVEFSDTEENATTSKTYNGFNFISNNATVLANSASIFVRGGTHENVTYPGLAGLLAENFIVNDVDLIARNQVSGTVGE
ncbi:MAG: hypothetical protein IJQ82_02370 [Selenomonadaceae bacterium]|nr:hypothetical protein [Selenomonadaceae bacterium]